MIISQSNSAPYEPSRCGYQFVFKENDKTFRMKDRTMWNCNEYDWNKLYSVGFRLEILL